MTRVTGLFVYPVKSLRGYAVPAADIDALGFIGDRRFLVVDESDKFLTQRPYPRMALINARLAGGMLTLSADGAGSVSVSQASDPSARLRSVTIWKHEGLLAEDCGPAVATWLSSFLGLPCSLVRIGPKFQRPMLKPASRPGDQFTFADGAPILVVSEASVAMLNDRIVADGGAPVPMSRFRPNLVVGGCAAFAEDTWSRLQIGDVILRSAGQSERCMITTTDQLTGERGKEPLRTLATFRRSPANPTEVVFGVNLINESKGGTIRLGDQAVFSV
ncbi:MAG TPA: MOSC N-terminal beta barrel domain-containing protein [Polyangia bacterium]|jgi:hypothetical protein|nr:MOSC N-terminal beta barrel domain-containing protein [Polyangia bacterium]